MTAQKTMRSILLASTCLLPLAVLADDDGKKTSDIWVEGGLQYQSATSALYGRYTGEDKNKGYGLGSFYLGSRDDWNSGNVGSWEVEGRNLGLDGRSVSVQFKEQGSWSAKLYYDGIPYVQSDSFRSVYNLDGTLAGGLTQAGTIAPILPLNYPQCTNNVAASSASCVSPNGKGNVAANALQIASWGTGIANQLAVEKVSTQRDKFGGSFSYRMGDWSFTGDLGREHKDGYKENSLLFGSSTSLGYPNIASSTYAVSGKTYYYPAALNTSVMYFPERVDYDTDIYKVSAAYDTARLQAKFSYIFSNFTDNKSAFSGQDPFQTVQYAGNLSAFGPNQGALKGATLTQISMFTPAGLPGGAVGPSYIPLTAAYALPPSNSSHQLRAQLAYNATPDTRIVATVQYGLQYQNDSFVPASGTPAIQANEPFKGSAANLGSGLDGLVETIFANVQLTAHPIGKMTLKASYTLDERDNKTSSRQYAAYVGDGALTDNGIVSNNLPYSFTRQKANVEASYPIFDETKISAGFTYNSKDTNYLPVDRNTETTEYIKLHSQLFSDLDGSLNLSHGNRTAKLGDPEAAWLALNSYGQTQPETNFLPYSLAPRTRDEIKGAFGWMQADGLGLDLSARGSNDHYPSYVYGMKEASQVEIDPSLSFVPNKNAAYHLFYSFEQQYQGAGFSFNNSAGTTIPWSTQTTDTVHTVGVMADWTLSDAFKLGAVYNLSYGNTAIREGDAYGSTPISSLTVNYASMATLPDTKNTLNHFQLHGEYQFTPKMSLWMGYTYEKMSSSDWTNSQQAVSAQYYNFVLPGDGNPSYTEHVVGAAMRLKL